MSRHVSIDASYAGGVPFVAIYRSWRGGAGRGYSNPTTASLRRIADWGKRHEANVRPWVTAIGWSLEVTMPDPLTDSQIERLARLMNSVTRMDPLGRFCHMTENGETLNVSRHYCAFCNGIHGHDHDGEDDCIHKLALFKAWQADVMAQTEDWQDLKATQAAVFP